MNESIIPIQLSRFAWEALLRHLDEHAEKIPVRPEIRRQLSIIDTLGPGATFEVIGKGIIRPAE